MKVRILVAALTLLLWSVPPHGDAQTTSSTTSPRGGNLQNQSSVSGNSQSQGTSTFQPAPGTQSTINNNIDDDDDDSEIKVPKKPKRPKRSPKQ